MRLFQKLPHLRLALLLGATTGLTAGCIVTLGPGLDCSECGTLGCNSELNGDDCSCEAGYEWCNPDDNTDYECCPADEACQSGSNNHVDQNDNCVCDPGYTWCDPDDVNNLDCCLIGDTETGGDGDGDSETGGDGDGDTGTTGVLPPETCSEEEEGSFWCTHTVEMGPVGSQTFECVNGEWVENPGWPQLDCTSSDYDFGVGCVYDESTMEYVSVCGDGPGDPCEEDTYEDNCADSDLLLSCFYTKVQSVSCQTFCETVGVDDVTYEMGICEVVDGVADCSCFDP